MFELSTSRNFDRRARTQFRSTLELPGWQNQSAWGYDEPGESYFAQLWHNSNQDETQPDIWLSGIRSKYARPGNIALEIMESTGHDPLTIVSAMGILDPAPRLRKSLDILKEIKTLTQERDNAYLKGQADALLWVVTGASPGPGSARQWLSGDGAPDAEQVAAEHHLVIGRLYEPGGNQDRHAGADEALMWALNRM